MSLLRDIQDAASDGNTSISVLLRKCKVLAKRIKSDAFAEWVEWELNGYPNGSEVPSYRVLVSPELRGNFQGPFNSACNNAPIPSIALPEELQAAASEDFMLRQSAGSWEDALTNGDGKGLPFMIFWPSNVVATLSGSISIYQGYRCLEMWWVVPRATLVTILDNVRNNILNFALDIEAENPEAGDAPANTTPVPEPIVQQIFNHYFNGSVGNVAIGSQNISQQSSN